MPFLCHVHVFRSVAPSVSNARPLRIKVESAVKRLETHRLDQICLAKQHETSGNTGNCIIGPWMTLGFSWNMHRWTRISARTSENMFRWKDWKRTGNRDMLHTPPGAPRWLCSKMFQSQPGELRISWKENKNYTSDTCEKPLAAFSQLVWNACSSVPFFL